MPSSIGKHNLDRDRNVLGRKWFSVYGGWFSDEENIRSFLDAVAPLLPKGELDVLYVASASGLLGERLLERLGEGNLTIVDISQEHLDENSNPRTKKVCADLLELDLGKKFDVVLMRSSLDYFPARAQQVEALKKVAAHLKPNGVFVNQPAYVSEIDARDCLSRAYNAVEKIGRRLFQSSDMESIYLEAGLAGPRRVGEGKVLEVSNRDHAERYGLNQSEVETVRKIVGNASKGARLTDAGYVLRFEFPIFLSHLRKV